MCLFFERWGNIVKVNKRKGETVLGVPYCAVDPKVSLPVRLIKVSVLTTVISMSYLLTQIAVVQYKLLQQQVGNQVGTAPVNSGSNPDILLMNKIATTVKVSS